VIIFVTLNRVMHFLRVSTASAVLRLMTSSNLAGREPQGLPGVPLLAQGGNVFAVSVA
jgi:hypothetical protein